MPDPIISPDGSSFWTGTEWAPTSDSNQITNLNLQDSVIGGDVNISMNSISEIKQAVDSALITHSTKSQHICLTLYLHESKFGSWGEEYGIQRDSYC